MSRRRSTTRAIASGLLGPEVRISGSPESHDGMVVRLYASRTTRAVLARYAEGRHTLVIERDELEAMLRVIDGKPVTDVHGMIHQTRRAVR